MPSHTVLDVRLGWRLSPRVALSLLVANALDRRHTEFATPAQAAQLGRTWFLKATFEL
ncbi:hypothetical protein D3C83_301620 [compost metagenome]